MATVSARPGTGVAPFATKPSSLAVPGFTGSTNATPCPLDTSKSSPAQSTTPIGRSASIPSGPAKGNCCAIPSAVRNGGSVSMPSSFASPASSLSEATETVVTFSAGGASPPRATAAQPHTVMIVRRMPGPRLTLSTIVRLRCRGRAQSCHSLRMCQSESDGIYIGSLHISRIPSRRQANLGSFASYRGSSLEFSASPMRIHEPAYPASDHGG